MVGITYNDLDADNYIKIIIFAKPDLRWRLTLQYVI